MAGTENSVVLEVKDVKQWYSQRLTSKKNGKTVHKQTVKAVDGVSFSLKKGEILGVIGESGCGKSTLGRVLVHLEDCTSGEIRLFGENTSEMLKKDPLRFRRTCQMVFQNPFDTFDPRHTLKRILEDPMRLHKIGSSDAERMRIILDILEQSDPDRFRGLRQGIPVSGSRTCAEHAGRQQADRPASGGGLYRPSPA